MKREDLLNTKWDVRTWTEEQKTQWQDRVFSLGFRWNKDNQYYHLDKPYYYLGLGSEIYYGATYFLFEKGTSKEKQYADMFPAETPAPQFAQEELIQYIVNQVEERNGVGESEEDERGFEGLVYVEPKSDVVVDYKNLSVEQRNFLLEVLHFKKDYGHNEPDTCHLSYDSVEEVWFTETMPIDLDKDVITSFNNLFKYEEDL